MFEQAAQRLRLLKGFTTGDAHSFDLAAMCQYLLSQLPDIDEISTAWIVRAGIETAWTAKCAALKPDHARIPGPLARLANWRAWTRSLMFVMDSMLKNGLDTALRVLAALA